MAPTIQTALSPDKRPQRPGEKRSELICRVKYCNTLPDIPFDPKFITYPFDPTRFYKYHPTSLERNYKYEVLTEHDLGVTIDLINRDTYACEGKEQLDPADEKLLEEDILTHQDTKRSRHHARSVSWLRRTEYISTEQTRFQPQTMDKVEAKVGYSIKKNFKDETLYMDRSSQIKAIEKTFQDNKTVIDKHYSKPNVVPVEIQPVYPDFKIWKYPCAQVIFDSDPAPAGRSVPAQIEEMSQAMIRGVMDESGEQFVAYFLPTADTLEKRRRDFAAGQDYDDDDEYEYKMAREYNWNVKSKSNKGYEENYFLVVRQDGIYYNELETRVRLSKRRQKVGQQPNNTRLVVKHRPLNAQEFRMQRYREKLLEPPGEEDEEEEEENKEDDKKSESERGSGSEGEQSDKEKDDNDDQQNGKKSDDENRNEENNSNSGSSSPQSPERGGEGEGENEEEERDEEHEADGDRTPAKSQSRSRSVSRSRSKSRSRSGSRSGSQSRSPSRSKSRSNSPKSPSRSRSPSRSKSRSPSRSKSRSVSRSPSPSGSGSGSASGSESNGSSSGAESEK